MPERELKKALIVSAEKTSGGREHALGWRLQQEGWDVSFTQHNAGTEQVGRSPGIPSSNQKEVARYAKLEKIGLVVPGPETPLIAGITDTIEKEGIPTFGPSKLAAQIEGSKWFATQVMEAAGVQYPTTVPFFKGEAEKAKEFVKRLNPHNMVIKADGECGGKGVVLPDTEEEAVETITDMMDRGKFGASGETILVQQRIKGKEVSVHIMTDGVNTLWLPLARDYKKATDNKKNTGGMGGFSPTDDVTEAQKHFIQSNILAPTLKQMRDINAPFKGFLYAGLMLGEDGQIYVIEFNCRGGDPETELMMRKVSMQTQLGEIMKNAAEGNIGSSKIVEDSDYVVGITLASRGYPDSSESGVPISGMNNSTSDSRIVNFHMGTRNIHGQLETNGGRVLLTTSKAPTLEEARRSAYIAANKIVFDGKQNRTDIAG